ncbi:heterokaryon incompatibility protein-domain-containing protein [Paraphoma chrysanthemicola]|uniref:Heterokaryon incompatibility protein-domain-containing protein n=1 Tax=Paraphoma chrysanthemicola TaxID=798071 RepID=A0A8K0RC39_9PLEO|nr:heterokaryon incompatibility protein-domain-containing protein [Paraphoma chrysanthemicola]
MDDILPVIESCPHCPDVGNVPNKKLQRCYLVYHEPCDESVCCSSNVEEIPLCDSCRHMRLWHIVCCLDEQTRDWEEINLRGRCQEMSDPDTDCPLCQVINTAVGTAYDFETDPLDSSLCTRLLDTSKDAIDSQDCNFSAAIIRMYHREDGTHRPGDTCGQLEITIGDTNSDVPRIGQWVNWGVLKGAIRNDRNSNADRRHQDMELKDLESRFRVIDVANRCIRTVKNCNYAALSYVWGADRETSLVALKRNIEELRVKGSLSDAILPRTIADAIKVCEQLEQEYLWVDRLCVIQDDAKDKARQIGMMGKIFSSAGLVIAAAHGDSMNSGIPGVGHPRRARQQTVPLPGLTVTNVVRGRVEEPLEVWRTRGWKYQEAVLARRLLLFYETRVVYEGVQYTESEDRFDRVAFPQYRIFYETPSATGNPWSIFDYARHVQNYAARSLPFQIDTYAAFNGITQALFGQKSTHFALPLLHFNRALRWYTSRHVSKSFARDFGGVCFPTWSWTSMMNQECIIEFAEHGYYGSLVAWYKLTKRYSIL